jgi:hypothetical protein
MAKMLEPITISAIQAEVINSQVKHGEHSMMNPELPPGERLAILVEEVGEVATALNYDQKGKRPDLFRELLQVAAMAAIWAEIEDKEQTSDPS